MTHQVGIFMSSYTVAGRHLAAVQAWRDLRRGAILDPIVSTLSISRLENI